MNLILEIEVIAITTNRIVFGTNMKINSEYYF